MAKPYVEPEPLSDTALITEARSQIRRLAVRALHAKDKHNRDAYRHMAGEWAQILLALTQ